MYSMYVLATDLGYVIKPPSRVQRVMHEVASSKPGAWALAHTMPAMDRATARLSHDRTTATQVLAGLPVLVVTTTGRRSGRPREAQLLGIPVGADLAIAIAAIAAILIGEPLVAAEVVVIALIGECL